jgi:pre-mRNA-splicing factor SYF1
MGEIDRARAIYMHISQNSDPRDDDQKLWKVKKNEKNKLFFKCFILFNKKMWEDFEIHHGNVDSF